MELENYLELFDKYDCSEWVIREMLGGIFAMAIFILFVLTFCVILIIIIVHYFKTSKNCDALEGEDNEDL